ncbi:MAG: GldG family protein [Pseudomonadota bacterium]
MNPRILFFNLLLFTAITLCAWLSVRYSIQFDWTNTQDHTLSAQSRALLDKLPGPLRTNAYTAPNTPAGQHIQTLLQRYQRHKSDIDINFVDPKTAPSAVREYGIQGAGELIINYQKRIQHIRQPDEANLSSALQNFLRENEHWLIFPTDHGERDPLSQANQDLGQWGQYLQQRGMRVRPLSFEEIRQIPDNTGVLVIAGSKTTWLPGEVALVRAFVEQGGNLLWLLEPGPLQGLEPVAAALGIDIVPGMVVDPEGNLYGVDDPTFIVVREYDQSPPTTGFDMLTLFPRPTALQLTDNNTWHSTPLIMTGAKAWLEYSDTGQTVKFDEQLDIPGPLTLGVSLTRTISEKTQRIIVLGDSDFLSNTYLGNSGNRELGMRVINWLAGEVALLDIPVRPSGDRELTLSNTAALSMFFLFLVILPLGLLGTGFYVWWRRR